MKGKQRFISLTESARQELELGRKTGSKSTYRQRCHYILLSDQGKTVAEISDIYQVVRQSVTRWFGRYEAGGIKGLHTSKGRGRPPIIRLDNEAELTEIERLVEQSPQNLSGVLAGIEKTLGKQMSKKTLQRVLKKKLVLEALPQDTP